MCGGGRILDNGVIDIHYLPQLLDGCAVAARPPGASRPTISLLTSIMFRLRESLEVVCEVV